MPAQFFGWQKALGIAMASEHGKRMLDKITKVYAIKAAEGAKPLCPVKHGILQKSLTVAADYRGRAYQPVTGTRVGEMAYLVGSGLPYAATQEYEHKTKSHFVHKSISKIIPKFKAEVKNTMIKAMILGWGG